MKQTFSLRRFWLLIRKHYTENRQNYLIWRYVWQHINYLVNVKLFLAQI